MKRLFALLLVLVLVLSAVPMTALAANPFTDVPTNAWFYADVDHAYQNNLINGKTPTLFMPNDYLTYAEAVKLAACMNQRYTTGSVTLENGDPWYQTYVDYCKTKKIIYVDYAWNQPATRAGYMEIFADALPSNAMKEINTVPDGSIPDVPMNHPQAPAIYKLYRVGILQGNDLEHNCNPGANIKRGEVAAILTRMMDASKRIEFSMDTEALRFTKQPENVVVPAGKAGTLSVEVAGGMQPYKYQWLISFDGAREQWAKVSGETYASLTVVPNPDAKVIPVYRCMVTDANDKVIYSELASISAETAELKIKTQPEGGTKKPGEKMTPFVEAEGGKQPYTYQWEAENGNNTWIKVPGATAAALNMGIGESAVGEDLIYRCVVTDANGKSVTSDPAVFKIVAAESPLKIVNQPSSIQAKAGDKPVFFMEVEGGKFPYTFQWMSKNAYGAGSVNGAYGVQTYDDMYWSKMQLIVGNGSDWTTNEEFYCVVTDAAGNKVTSNTFTISLVGPVSITTNTVTSVKTGSVVELVVVAHGGNSGQYKFIWMGGNSHTSAVTGWNGVSITTSGSKSVMTIDTSKCKETMFAVRVEDAKDSSNFANKDWSYNFSY